MLCNISFVALIISLIISKQRVTSSVSPLFTEEAPLLVFQSSSDAQHLGHFEFTTLLMSSSAFSKRPKFSVPYHPIGRTCGIGTSKFISWDQIIFAFCKFSSHHSNGWVPMSSAKVFFQETPAWYRTPGLWQYTKMSTSLKSPDRLKNAECKKGQLSNRLLIPYVPEVDIITPKEEPQVFKVKLPDESHLSMPIYFHVVTMRNTLHTLLQSSKSSIKKGCPRSV
jgi:hypothetical protein